MTEFDEYERRAWRGRAATYARSFALMCAYPAPALLDAAGVGAGHRVLDVGTGPGTVAALACARGAAVTAVDPEESMLDAARRNAPAADVRHGVLPRLDLGDGAFDAVTANFVLNHVGDPPAALAELRRVTRPGGRIAFTVWPYPLPLLQRLWGDVSDALGLPAPQQPLPRVAAEVNFSRTPDGLRGLMERVGLVDLGCQELAWTHEADPDDWWAAPASGMGSLGKVLVTLPPEGVAEARAHYERLTADHRTPAGRLALPTGALIASGTVPR
ncbi:class I SAM-dependent methyltransferase [Catellatospora sp. NPDC049609]|uniref:class I SAM-dependent methyltransferase n=1 Tax=Catellatospora sp. NPDC049609 TaxID=3155505 RepID=UPI00342E01DA